MPAYLLDTNHCSYLMNGKEKRPEYRKLQEINAIAKYETISSDPIYMSEVSLSELCLGAEKSPHLTSIYQRINAFRSITPCLAVSSDCWELHGKVKWEILKSGRKMEDFDLLIACIAKKYGCTLVTNDGNFSNLPAGFVPIENWSIGTKP